MIKEDHQKPEAFTRRGMIIGCFSYLIFALIIILIII